MHPGESPNNRRRTGAEIFLIRSGHTADAARDDSISMGNNDGISIVMLVFSASAVPCRIASEYRIVRMNTAHSAAKETVADVFVLNCIFMVDNMTRCTKK